MDAKRTVCRRWAQPVLLLTGLVLLGAWLAQSGHPTDRRIGQLNALIASGALGRAEPPLQRRLSAQFAWLARHSGANIPVLVNGPIRRHQLTLIVTTPQFERLTHCGAGNAIFDPVLNTIFVDHALVWPTDVNIIGTPSVNSMFTVNDLGYVVSYTNFILAHELGHWQAHDRGAAFFYYGFNEGSADLGVEEAADRLALRTLLAAGEAADEPSELRTLDATSVMGLSGAALSPRERAAADVLGGVLLMSDDMLFAASRFSPYYADRSHPDLLRRIRNAIRQTQASGTALALESEDALVQAELGRFAALGSWPHRELFLPGPLWTADVRAGSLWLGRTDIPNATVDQLEEQIYKFPLSVLDVSRDTANTLRLPTPVKVGRSKVGKAFNYEEGFGSWVDQEFERGDPSIGLPPAPPAPTPQADKVHLVERGVVREYMTWRWPAERGVPAGELTEPDVRRALRKEIGTATLGIGNPQWNDRAIELPVSVSGVSARPVFRVYTVHSTKPLRLVEAPAYGIAPGGGAVDVEAATFWRGSWWVPVRFAAGRPGDRFELWSAQNGATRRFAAANLLLGETGRGLRLEALTRLAARNPKFTPLSGVRAVFGYDNDSLYLLDVRTGASRVVFHPARPGLRVLDLGAGRVLFWTLHARKAYLVDTNG